MNLTCILVFSLILISIKIFSEGINSEATYVTSSIDGNQYLVGNLPRRRRS